MISMVVKLAIVGAIFYFMFEFSEALDIIGVIILSIITLSIFFVDFGGSDSDTIVDGGDDDWDDGEGFDSDGWGGGGGDSGGGGDGGGD